MAINENKVQRSIVRYVPSPPPRGEMDANAVAQYLYRELKKISSVIDNVSKNRFEILYEFPEKPRDGDVIYADGVNIDPTGFGIPGIFVYNLSNNQGGNNQGGWF